MNLRLSSDEIALMTGDRRKSFRAGRPYQAFTACIRVGGPLGALDNISSVACTDVSPEIVVNGVCTAGPGLLTWPGSRQPSRSGVLPDAREA